MHNMELLVQAINLKKSFGDLRAVDGVSLQFLRARSMGSSGRMGQGRRQPCVCLSAPCFRMKERSLFVDTMSIRQTEQARSQIGYLSQRFSMYEDLTVLENIRFFAEVRGLKSDEWLPRCMEILEFVGLEKFKDRRAGQLSGGMKQKLGLASALVTRPRVLLLDEPTTGVDPVTRQDFWQLVIHLASSAAGRELARSRSVFLSSSPPPTWMKPHVVIVWDL